MRTQIIRLTVVLNLLFLTLAANAQHSVKITTPGGQMITISGDSTKYFFKANVANYEGRFKDAANLKLKGIEMGESKNESGSYYDVACYFSLAGDKENGFKYLKRSLDSGYDDIAHMLFDKDLKILREDKSWKSELKKPMKAYFKLNNEDLANMFGEDQAARLSGGKIDWDELKLKDAERRNRVMKLVAKDKVKSAHDYYKAAFIMHHGYEVEDYKMAHDLALKAIEFDDRHRMSPWLAAATKDRYLLKAGKPQWYGTQGMEFLQKTRKMGINPDKIDTTAVSDDQRKAWNAPSIEQIRTYVNNYISEQEQKEKEN
ncbi:MAG: hypothetical protein HEP71_20020 [Roseivirga sp.]|nr:hypothetical protein [Roseivirga sp.]